MKNWDERIFFFIFYLAWQGLPIFNKAEMHFALEAHSIVTQNLQSLWEIAFSATLDSIIKLTINRIPYPSDFTIFCIFFILSGDSGKKIPLAAKLNFHAWLSPEGLWVELNSLLPLRTWQRELHFGEKKVSTIQFPLLLEVTTLTRMISISPCM